MSPLAPAAAAFAEEAEGLQQIEEIAVVDDNAVAAEEGAATVAAEQYVEPKQDEQAASNAAAAKEYTADAPAADEDAAQKTEGEGVATIGDRSYDSLSAAVAAANENDMVTLASDVELTETLVIDKPLTLDLGGHSVTVAFKSNIDNPVIKPTNSVLSLVGDGSITTNGSYAIGLDGNGSGIVLDGPSVHADGENAIGLVGSITDDNEYYVTIRSGELSSPARTVDLSGEWGKKLVDISGGTLKGARPLRLGFVDADTSAPISDAGKLTISGGSFEGSEYSMQVSRGVGSITITDGSFHGRVQLSRGECNNWNFVSHDLIAGGVFYSDFDVYLTADNGVGSTVGYAESAYERELIHHPFISGGIYLNEDGSQARSIYKKYLNEGYEQDAASGAVLPADAAFAIRYHGYPSLNEAFKAAKSGDTITLVKDAEADGCVSFIQYANEHDKYLTLDLNGHTLSNAKGNGDPAKNATINSSLDRLTIIDSSAEGTGKILNTSDSGCGVYGLGDIVVEGGTIESAHGEGIHQEQLALTVNGGSVSGETAGIVLKTGGLKGSVTINGGSVSAGNGPSVCYERAAGRGDTEFTINGGRFSDDAGNGLEFARVKDQVLQAEDDGWYAFLPNGPVFGDIDCNAVVALDDHLGIGLDVNNLLEGTEPADYTVRYWVGDDETNAKEKKLADMKSNHFELASFSATQMCERAHVRVYYKDWKDPVKVMDLSLRDYCDRQIEESKESGDQKTVDFCKATLTYGAAAQELFGYKTNDLATKTYVSPINDVVVPDDFAAKTPGATAGAKRLTQALSLGSRVAINTYIEPADGVGADDLVLTVDGVAVQPKKTVADDATDAKITRKTLSDGRILLQISGIAPRDYDHAFEIGVSDGKQTSTVTSSVLSYAYAAQDDEKEELAKTAKALYNFYLAAEAIA